jgi:hypothetical protein
MVESPCWETLHIRWLLVSSIFLTSHILVLTRIVRVEGSRHAFEDALRLSRILVTVYAAGIPERLRSHEIEMLPRGREAVSRSRAVLDPAQGADMKIAWGHPLQLGHCNVDTTMRI